MALPDALSRHHPQAGPEVPLDIAIHHAHLTTQQKTAFQDTIAADPELWVLSQMIIDWWTEVASDIPKNFRKYFAHASTLTVEDGFILWTEAILIPESEWAQVQQQLHNGHQGITKMNLWAKNVIYGPGMTKDIEWMFNTCNTCQYSWVRQCDLLLQKQPTPDCPWQIMASDFFILMEGNTWLWPTCTQRYALCGKCLLLEQHQQSLSVRWWKYFLNMEYQTLKSDNGPQYASAAFTEFAEGWGLQHTTSSSHYPASTRFAESMVKIIKTAFTKAKYSGKDSQPALLALHNTPADSHLPSPAQLLYQWKLKADCLHTNQYRSSCRWTPWASGG